MKTVITDNSLCTLPISEHAKSEHIYRYIEALGEMGIKYVELDFRTVMKMSELPENVGYIFRLGNPMFAELTEVFDFSYVLLTVHDFKEKIRVRGTPAIIEFPAVKQLSNQLVAVAQHQLETQIAMVRLRGSYSLMRKEEAGKYISGCKSAVPMPVDFCPMNKFKTALDTALKFSAARADSLTMCMGLPNNYASIEEFFFTLMSVHESLPEEYSISAMCKAAVYHQVVFGPGSADSISYIMSLLDNDILHLRNADTGKRVPMAVTLKNKMLLQRNFVSALENFIDSEEIPDDFAYDITEAIKRYDVSLINTDIMYNRDEHKKPLQ